MLLWDYSSTLKFSDTSRAKPEVAVMLLQDREWRTGLGTLKAGLSEASMGHDLKDRYIYMTALQETSLLRGC